MSASKYILQYGSLAAWPFRVAEGLREWGYPSVNVIPETGDVEDLDRQLPHDRFLSRKSASKATKFIDRTRFMLEVADSASLVHYHGGVIQRSSWHHLIEGPLFARKGIPMVMSFGGGDARIISQARAANPYFYREADEARDARTRAYLRSISRYIRIAATDYEMKRYVEPYFDQCFIFRQPVRLDVIPFSPPVRDRPPVVLHIPTEPWVKGTDYIVAAAEALKREGHHFEFRLRRQLTQTEFYREIADCDIYVDELRCGCHGVTAVETMAAGKPTVTYIRPDLVGDFPAELPLVNANPDTIYARLKALICDTDQRCQIAHDSRRYVEKYHDVRIVVQNLLDCYKAAGLSLPNSALGTTD